MLQEGSSSAVTEAPSLLSHGTEDCNSFGSTKGWGIRSVATADKCESVLESSKNRRSKATHDSNFCSPLPRIAFQGGVKCYACWSDESLNKQLRDLTQFCHRRSFGWRVHAMVDMMGRFFKNTCHEPRFADASPRLARACSSALIALLQAAPRGRVFKKSHARKMFSLGSWPT